VILVDDVSELTPAADDVALAPVDIDGQTVYLTVRGMGVGLPGSGEEREIADRRPRLDSVLGGVAGFAKQVVGTLQETGASKVSVEFGCEFALEFGTFVAIIGKASSKSTLTVGLEWTKPEE
jgi:Trypsin-co-occurring domain 1